VLTHGYAEYDAPDAAGDERSLLSKRGARPADPGAEAAAFAEVIRTMAQSPAQTYESIAAAALRLCRAGSAGISLLDSSVSEPQLRWPAVTGMARGQVSGSAPAACVPCGLAIARAEALLLRNPGACYPVLATVRPPITEAICVPVQLEGRVVGTLWAMAHDAGTAFDVTDARILETLGCFVATAVGGGDAQHELDELRVAQVALAESEENFRTLAESLPAKLFVSDAEGRTTYANRRLYQVTGAPPGSLTGLGWTAYVHPDDLPAVQATMRHAMRTGSPYQMEYRFRTKGGYRRFLVRGNQVQDERGAILGWCGAAIDVEDERQAQAALQAANDSKDVFLATLAHELRNPLAPIRNAARVLAAPAAERLDTQWCRDVIGRQVAIMARLLDDLLDISRITRGKLELRKEVVLLWPLLDAAIETSRPLIDSHGHELVVQPSHEPVRLEVDPVRITQVVSNLLNNAAKFTPDGGRIELSVRTEGREVVIDVKDSGIGLPAGAHDRIFTMFSQVSKRRGDVEGGLGIGLALVKGLVSMHGGRVEAFSEGPGLGATFRVVLPRARSTNSSPAQPSVGVSKTRPLRILVVDDNVDITLSLALLLELEGHIVCSANSGVEALARTADFEPQLALLDVGMPDMNGYELAARLRRLPRAAQITLIAVTGWGTERDKARALEAGFDHHLTKPVDPDQLSALVREVGERVCR
jgi:PAS domain S-box-containing protein